jgi:fluoride exporter
MSAAASGAATLLAVFIGAGSGACARHGLNLWLNERSPALPLGTLAANLIGGYLVGIAVAVLAARPEWSPLWRALWVTGLLGGLTTFSAFSAEVVQALLRGQWASALTIAAAHLLGSLALTALGIATVRAFTA